VIENSTDDDIDIMTGIFRHTREKVSGDWIKLKMVVFWDIAPCSQIETERRFRGACCSIIRVVTVRTSNLACRKLHDEELHTLYSSTRIIKLTKIRRVEDGCLLGCSAV
jgi:hypothetical protein